MANAAVGTPQGRKPEPVPSSIDGKAATATHVSINPNKSGSAKLVAPVEIPTNVKMGKPQVAVQAAKPGGEKAVVTYVEDGDGAVLKRGNGKEVVCRIDTIDAPESPKAFGKRKEGQPFGEQAKRTLQSMIENKEVTLIITQEAAPGPKTKENNYGRSLCKIEVEGVGVDQKMLQAGAAWLYRKYGKYYEKPDPKLQATEADARARRVGVWADVAVEDPADYRKRTQ